MTLKGQWMGWSNDDREAATEYYRRKYGEDPPRVEVVTDSMADRLWLGPLGEQGDAEQLALI